MTNARKQRQQQIRERTRMIREAARKARAVAAEQAAEDIAPAAQRHAVVDAAGNVVRSPRLVPDGVTFKRANPLSSMSRASITPARERAADRFARAWEDGGRGVGSGAMQYGERTSGEVSTGFISDGVIAKLAYQTRARAEYAAACMFLGTQAAIVRAVVLDGMSCEVFANGRPDEYANPQVARGYLLAGLDRLVDFYHALARERREREGEMVA